MLLFTPLAQRIASPLTQGRRRDSTRITVSFPELGMIFGRGAATALTFPVSLLPHTMNALLFPSKLRNLFFDNIEIIIRRQTEVNSDNGLTYVTALSGLAFYPVFIISFASQIPVFTRIFIVDR